MKCPKCDHEFSINFVGYSEIPKQDFYEYVKSNTNFKGECIVYCTMEFSNVPDGMEKLIKEGYKTRGSGCDVIWFI